LFRNTATLANAILATVVGVAISLYATIQSNQGVEMKKKSKKKIKKEKPKQRNWLAVHAFQRSGAGPHEPKKYSRKTKHKNKEE